APARRARARAGRGARRRPGRAAGMSDDAAEFPPVRRVVTGEGADGVARILIDAPAGNVRRSKSGGRSTLVWCTDRAPAGIPRGKAFEDMGARILGTPPPRNGTRFAVNDIPPG